MHGYGGPSHSRQAHALVLSALSGLELSCTRSAQVYMRSTALNHHKPGGRPDLYTRCADPRYMLCCAALAVLRSSRGAVVPAGLDKTSHVV